MACHSEVRVLLERHEKAGFRNGCFMRGHRKNSRMSHFLIGSLINEGQPLQLIWSLIF